MAIDIEGALQDLGRRVAFPPTPDLAAAVGRRIAAAGKRSRWVLPELPRLVLVAAALVAVLTAAVLVVPPVRDTLARFFHVQGVVIERHPVNLTPGARAFLDLGAPTNLDEARARVTFPVLVPQALKAAGAVYVRTPPPGGEVTLAYAPGPGLPEAHSTGVGLLLTEFRGSLAPEFFGKIMGSGTTLQEVEVAGTRGYWLTGSPHVFFYHLPGGNPIDEPLRLAGNTLLWEQNGVTLRIESSLDREAAVRVANSLR